MFKPSGTEDVSGEAECDIAPLADRLLLFYPDYRCPHAVMPAAQRRFAVTIWYMHTIHGGTGTLASTAAGDLGGRQEIDRKAEHAAAAGSGTQASATNGSSGDTV